jgi:hypothetical protein
MSQIDSGRRVTEVEKKEVHLDSSPILRDLNTEWDVEKFKTPRVPLSIGFIPEEERELFCKPGVPKIRDMPIKFPGSDVRLPKELVQFEGVIRKIMEFELRINPEFDDYYCYLEVDQSTVIPGRLQRELPCHVDGFQGPRWNPKVKINHSYLVGSALPTVFYPQSFDLTALDEAKHNFFWEMNRQVAETDSKFAFQGEPFEIQLMDAYTVHRGCAATEPTERTWVRLSFEVRIFDRIGNTKNPMFDYNWEMLPRDIEDLNLEAFDPTSEPSLRTYGWRGIDGVLLGDDDAWTSPQLKKPPALAERDFG